MLPPRISTTLTCMSLRSHVLGILISSIVYVEPTMSPFASIVNGTSINSCVFDNEPSASSSRKKLVGVKLVVWNSKFCASSGTASLITVILASPCTADALSDASWRPMLSFVSGVGSTSSPYRLVSLVRGDVNPSVITVLCGPSLVPLEVWYGEPLGLTELPHSLRTAM